MAATETKEKWRRKTIEVLYLIDKMLAVEIKSAKNFYTVRMQLVKSISWYSVQKLVVHLGVDHLPKIIFECR